MVVDAPRRCDVVVTGVSITNSVADGADELCKLIFGGAPITPRTATMAGYVIHPIIQADYGRRIANPLDRKRWGATQNLGVLVAGDALDAAGLVGRQDVLKDAAIVIAGTGGERDINFDLAIFDDIPRFQNPTEFNRKLHGGTRPSLFLSQLPNLLAGNLSITYGLAGASRTIIGEELAGANALQIAFSLVEQGSFEVVLVGGAFSAEREDLLLLYASGADLVKTPADEIGKRPGAGGFVLGSGGAFLVVESASHARSRGAKALCRLKEVSVSRGRTVSSSLLDMIDRNRPGAENPNTQMAVVSGANGAEPRSSEELSVLSSKELPYRVPTSIFGHSMEPSFLIHSALAALSLQYGRLYSRQAGDADQAGPGISDVLVTSFGHANSGAFALLGALS